VVNHHNWCQHFADPEKPDDGLFLFFFPNVTLNVYGGGMSSFRTCPTDDPSTTRMEFDYYNIETGEAFEEYYKFVRQVAIEDFELCENAQYNLEKGIYAEGIVFVSHLTIAQSNKHRHRNTQSSQRERRILLSIPRPRIGARAASEGSVVNAAQGQHLRIGQLRKSRGISQVDVEGLELWSHVHGWRIVICDNRDDSSGLMNESKVISKACRLMKFVN
jgi:hypothetical protein